MKDRLLVLFLITLFFFGLPGILDAAGQQTEITIVLNGEIKSYSPAPVIVDDRVLIPARAVFEDLNALVNWDPETRQITISRLDDAVQLGVGQVLASVNLEDYVLSTPPQLINGYTYLPLAFFVQALGAEVSWDPGTRTVTVSNLRLGPPLASLAGVEGRVLATILGGMPALAQTGMELHEGDELETGPDGEAVVAFSNGSRMRLAPSSRITIQRLEEQKDGGLTAGIFAWAGRIWSHVAKLSGRGSGYTITTPTAVAGVRGTSFEVEVNPGTGGSTVKVVTGEVAVTGGQPGDLETVIVRPDESTDVAWEKTPGRPKAVDPDKLDAWQRKNKELDQEDVQRWEDEKQQRKEFLNQLKEKKKELNELHREMGDALRQLAAEMKDIPAAKLEALFEEKGIRKQPPGQEKKQEGQVETGVEPSENESAGAESSGDNPPDLQKNGNGKSNGKGSQVSRERLEQLIETIQSIAQTQDDHQNVQGTPEESEEPGKPDKPDKPEKPGKP